MFFEKSVPSKSLCCATDVVADPTQPCYDKVALLIGNRHYHHGRLKLNTPEADTQDLAGILRSADFKVVSLVNLTKQEMDQVCTCTSSLMLSVWCTSSDICRLSSTSHLFLARMCMRYSSLRAMGLNTMA